MFNDKLQIVTIKTVFKDNITVPPYQRPYRWTTDSAMTLFTDIYNACSSNAPEYRIGSVVLFRNSKNNTIDIVDGLQRLTTLTILMYCCLEKTQKLDDSSAIYPELLNAEMSELSSEAIINNYQILKRKINEFGESRLKDFKEYLLNKCTVVRIIANNEQEAFQFFDSQNSRGKALAPHDLLKSYHLREMRNDNETEKIRIINDWEATNQKELNRLFSEHLYPLVKWYKFQDGIDYSTKNIKTFKGIMLSNNYNFSVYNRAANLYIERFNHEGMYELASGHMINQFQLTQPIIAGKRFFEYTLHYLKLKNDVEQLIKDRYESDELIPEYGAGDRYVKQLFVNILVFCADRFNIVELTKARTDMMYRWAYTLRIVMKSVYRESVNRYAKGDSDRVKDGINMFSKISEMQDPSEMDAFILDKISIEELNKYKVNIDKYNNIINFIMK
ncbi:MAG: DUF262 domain-containing protein [Clostridia bacterium]|nr:DUF262 domain-containing protein [Clostridia bacterium]